MLCNLQSISEILVSPDDGKQLHLVFDPDGVLVSCSSLTRNYRVFQGAPVLLPISSVAAEEGDLASLVPRRRHPILRAISRFISGSNRVAAINAKKFLELLRSKNKRPRILVVGAGLVGDGSQLLYETADVDVIAFDIYRTEYVQMVADAHSIPLADGSVDGVWVQAVLEHVVVPEKVVGEMHRVLKHEGLVYSETPFMQQVHEGRFDFQRFSESGHRWLFRKFEHIDSGVVWGPGWALQWSIRYFFWGLTRSRMLGLVLSAPFMFVRWFDSWIPRDFRSDGASNLFFMGKKTEDEISVNEIITFYKGAQQ
jgi:SAM-dependent methyltransferase